jgi:CBS domain-containing protein|tara:strand:- start:3618 stop:4064 length:447 start_codon:yes stop_codon:yes gene_type:complete
MDKKIVPDVIGKQTIWSTSQDASVFEAARLMSEKKIGGVLVIAEPYKLVGIITERDLTTKVIANNLNPKKTRVEEIMTTNVHTISPKDSPRNALAKMKKLGFRHLPVVDNNRIVGIVSIRDLYSFVQKELKKDIQQKEEFMFGTGYGG